MSALRQHVAALNGDGDHEMGGATQAATVANGALADNLADDDSDMDVEINVARLQRRRSLAAAAGGSAAVTTTALAAASTTAAAVEGKRVGGGSSSIPPPPAARAAAASRLALALPRRSNLAARVRTGTGTAGGGGNAAAVGPHGSQQSSSLPILAAKAVAVRVPVPGARHAVPPPPPQQQQPAAPAAGGGSVVQLPRGGSPGFNLGGPSEPPRAARGFNLAASPAAASSGEPRRSSPGEASDPWDDAEPAVAEAAAYPSHGPVSYTPRVALRGLAAARRASVEDDGLGAVGGGDGAANADSAVAVPRRAFPALSTVAATVAGVAGFAALVNWALRAWSTGPEDAIAAFAVDHLRRRAGEVVCSSAGSAGEDVAAQLITSVTDLLSTLNDAPALATLRTHMPAGAFEAAVAVALDELLPESPLVAVADRSTGYAAHASAAIRPWLCIALDAVDNVVDIITSALWWLLAVIAATAAAHPVLAVGVVVATALGMRIWRSSSDAVIVRDLEAATRRLLEEAADAAAAQAGGALPVAGVISPAALLPESHLRDAVLRDLYAGAPARRRAAERLWPKLVSVLLGDSRIVRREGLLPDGSQGAHLAWTSPMRGADGRGERIIGGRDALAATPGRTTAATPTAARMSFGGGRASLGGGSRASLGGGPRPPFVARAGGGGAYMRPQYQPHGGARPALAAPTPPNAARRLVNSMINASPRMLHGVLGVPN